MQFEVRFEEDLDPRLYAEYSRFVFSKVKRTVRSLVKKSQRKYKVRESAIKECSILRWKKIPDQVDLTYYILNCLELVRIKGVYVIRLNEKMRLPHSYSTVSTLVRVLEYGTESIPSLPLVRRVLNYYRRNYKNLYVEFMEERFKL